MKFLSNEVQYDDPNQIRAISAQSVSRPVGFEEESYSAITISFKPTSTLTKDTVQEQTFMKSVSNSLTQSKQVKVVTKDGNEQTALPDATFTTYNQIKDSSKPQVIEPASNNGI